MNSELAATAAGSTYPDEPHRRKHGPAGYTEYASYKPWLRDEFCFRCAYCLTREQWCQDRMGTMSVDHFEPQAESPHRRLEYDNLIYVCGPCNRSKGTASLPLHPSVHALGQHLRFTASGRIEGLTPEGRAFVEILILNDPIRLQPRRLIVELLQFLDARVLPEARVYLDYYLGFPDDLPDLARLRPPGGNSRPDGVKDSYFQQRIRGTLPPMY